MWGEDELRLSGVEFEVSVGWVPQAGASASWWLEVGPGETEALEIGS